MSHLGRKIKAARQAAGLTSAQLAQRVQRTPQYIRLIECGGATPSMQTALALCAVFPGEVAAAWLWLLLTDLWGEDAVTKMRVHPARGGRGRVMGETERYREPSEDHMRRSPAACQDCGMRHALGDKTNCIEGHGDR